MDFKIETDWEGIGHLLYQKNTDIRSNIFILMNINKGTFFLLPWLGNELYKIKKVTDQNINVAKIYIESALQPLLKTGRATSINVTVEKDTQDFNRINYKIEATQPNGLIITYKSFKLVY